MRETEKKKRKVWKKPYRSDEVRRLSLRGDKQKNTVPCSPPQQQTSHSEGVRKSLWAGQSLFSGHENTSPPLHGPAKQARPESVVRGKSSYE